MRRVMKLGAVSVIAAALVGGSAAAVSAHSDHGDHGDHGHRSRGVQHVLLISVDGMHQSDLDWYIANHPGSELAKLASGGAEFTNNHTSDPSDSDPGGTAIMTGGDPRATGVYYDVEYSHAVDEAGAACTPGQPATGGDVIYDSPDDKLNAVPDLIPGNTSGQTFPSFDEGGSIYPGGDDKNPGLIMGLTPAPQSGLNPGSFPVDPKTCQPIQPWDYLKVNSIFGVIHNAGLRTAWSDKHAIYTSFNGHGSGGTAIDDFFGPEIDSQAVEPNGTPYTSDTDWAHDDAATKQYDGYKVQAVINELNGYDHSGKNYVGTPAILGMNFQTVSVAQKVDSASTLIKNADGSYTESPADCGSSTPPDPLCLAGYYPGTTTPRPLLASALDYVNAQLAAMDDAIQANPQTRGTTAIIITAKHGQSPQNPLLLKRIPDGPIINAINAAWTAKTGDPNKLIVAGTDDDLWQSYLSVKTQAAADFVKNYLWNHSATAVLYNNDGNNTRGPNGNGTEQVPHSGLAQIYAGHEAARFFGVPYGDPRYPDVFGRVQVGTVYTGGTKIAEHGGDNPNDRDVPLLVYAPGTVRPSSSDRWVETTQVAPTILRLLGLDPRALDAVQIEGTQVLPGIGRGHDGR
ncbi:MAG TPA: alkaline phosphatase family protein [Solirubrobacteraceae bacterium]|nr:alkaline phosphatase family protein [Solirubrobacteraceae bacterium]